jgi:hypothetical protein
VYPIGIFYVVNSLVCVCISSYVWICNIYLKYMVTKRFAWLSVLDCKREIRMRHTNFRGYSSWFFCLWICWRNHFQHRNGPLQQTLSCKPSTYICRGFGCWWVNITTPRWWGSIIPWWNKIQQCWKIFKPWMLWCQPSRHPYSNIIKCKAYLPGICFNTLVSLLITFWIGLHVEYLKHIYHVFMLVHFNTFV